MKVYVTAEQVRKDVTAQRERVRAKKEEALAFLATQERLQKMDKDTARGRVVRQVHALIASMDGHLRRLDAVLDLTQGTPDYWARLDKYVAAFVDSPYDQIIFLKEDDPSDDIGWMGQLSRVVSVN